MIDLIMLCYIGYGLYYAGKNFPSAKDYDGKSTEWLLISMLMLIVWPVFKGMSERKKEGNE